MRKYLRFSTRTMLFAATVVAMALCWIRWPMMTASSFVANPDVPTDRIIVDFDTLDEQIERIRFFASDERNSGVELKAFNRTFVDVLLGVQHFDYGMYDVTARRGKVAVYGPYFSFGAGKIRR
ncbi:hypothetical protein-signal peptide prediction [Rhodopirellula baltica SH 1]|uniref:Uncharacterized protein n=3 Tax=Rhodopirellula baltica TaxID=265606 RepID=Q7UUR4_RHOBA|nr:hypothetical protein-signal peptide prediction [Rhodopirellula baltica SH 1]